MAAENTDSHVDVIIIGAGVCGLYAGLTALRAGKSVLILEKEPRIGGLAAGFQFGENTCDFGVHMLHAFNKEIFEDCAAMMGKERIEAALDARIRWGKTTCRYPLKFADMLTAMPPFTLFRCVAGLVIAELSGAKHQPVDNAEDALVSYYGSPLYEFFFEEFTHKYWGIHPRDLSAEFVRRKMPRLSAVEFIRKCIPSFSSKKKGLVESALETETLHYSKSGSETLPRSLYKEIVRLGGIVKIETDIVSITQQQNAYSVSSVEDKWTSSLLLNTAPLNTFVRLINGPDFVSAAASQLKYKPTVVWAILVNHQHCMEGLYTYYRNRVFHRVGNPVNAGLVVKPDGHSLLIVETTCDIGDEKWLDTIAFRKEIISDLIAEDIIESEENIVNWLHLKNAYAYPIYDLGFDQHLEVVREWLDGIETLESTGRQGGFTYPAMHTAMQMGKDAVLKLMNTKF